MPNSITGRYSVTQKYLMTRGQAINFPAKFFNTNFKKDEVFGVVVDIPMASDILTTMVCFINGAANLYFNNGGEYTGASQKYLSLVQATHALVSNAGQLLPKATYSFSQKAEYTRLRSKQALFPRASLKSVMYMYSISVFSTSSETASSKTTLRSVKQQSKGAA